MRANAIDATGERGSMVEKPVFRGAFKISLFLSTEDKSECRKEMRNSHPAKVNSFIQS